MALGDRVITLVGLAQLDFPDRTVRLTDGGTAKMDGNVFASKDAVFGTIAQADEIEQAMGDAATDGGLSLYIPQDTPLATVYDPALQLSRVQLWQGEKDSATGEVLVADRLLDGLVDQVSWEPIERKLTLTLMDRGERLFMVNRGNTCSSSWHQKVFPGERGFDNCNDVKFQKAWGTAGPPRGTTSAGGARAGGGRGVNARVLAQL